MGETQRTVPRPFSLHWGKGQSAEEARVAGKYHEPAIQLLDFDDGSLEVRFCYFDHAGRFQRSPLIVGKDEIADLRRALAKTRRLRALLRRMAG